MSEPDDVLLARTMRRLLAADHDRNHVYVFANDYGYLVIDGRVCDVPKEELEAIARVLITSDKPYSTTWLPLVRRVDGGRFYLDPSYTGNGETNE